MEKEKCDRCSKKADVFLPYGPHSFCRQHFLRFFEKRARKTIRKNGLVKPGEKLVVACSGGKDSCVTLYLMEKFFGKTHKVEALLIDEGIQGYRDAALRIAEGNCRKWGIPFKRVSFAGEFGFSMVDVMRKTGAKKKIGSTCSFCGVLRRRLMDKHAKKMGAGKLVTGHNLDDESQSILMNILNNDLTRLLRLGAVAGIGESKRFVPRVKPLYETPEADVISFAAYAGVKHYSKQCCPFKWQAKRNDFRGIVNYLEASYPGTMFSLIRFFEQAKQMILKNRKSIDIGVCENCGEPSSQSTCAVCKKINGLGLNDKKTEKNKTVAETSSARKNAREQKTESESQEKKS